MLDASSVAVDDECGELILLTNCEMCGAPYLKKRKDHKYCSDKCRYKAKLGQINRERARQRCRDWYAKNRDRHLKNVALWRKTKRAIERSTKRAPTTVDMWRLPAPEMDYLPGGGFTLDLRPRYKFDHRHISALHGIVTAITGSHAQNMPRFALVPWPSGCGWGVYVGDRELARLASGKAHCVRFDGGPAVLHCGPLLRIKAPRVAPGVHRLRIDAITPVHIRCDNSTVTRKIPTSAHLRGTLEGFMPRRLGVPIPPGTVALNLIEDHSHPEFVELYGNGRKLNGPSGWVGHVIVETNAVGRFLLECCALGMGYGGKVAFGFGRIRVSEA